MKEKAFSKIKVALLSKEESKSISGGYGMWFGGFRCPPPCWAMGGFPAGSCGGKVVLNQFGNNNCTQQ